MNTARWRCALAVAAVCELLALSPLACAQGAAKSYRIAVLSQGNPPTNDVPGSDLRQGLRDWGYVEGRNLKVDFRYAAGSVEKLPELAGELVGMKVDLIVTVGDSAAMAAKRATTSIPIVATEFGSDPVKAGIISSLGRPEGNVTGLYSISEELWQKRLSLLRELVPHLTKVAVIWNPGNPGNVACLNEIRAASGALGMLVLPFEVRDTNSVERAFGAVATDKPEALALCWDSVTIEYANAIADFALKQRLPTVAPIREYVKAGALMSFGTSLAAHRRRAVLRRQDNQGYPARGPARRTTHEIRARRERGYCEGARDNAASNTGHAGGRSRSIEANMVLRLARLAVVFGIPLLVVPAAAQQSLGTVLDAGAKRITAKEFETEIVQHVVVGPLPSGGEVEFMYTGQGKIAGTGTHPLFWHNLVSVGGEWKLDEAGRTCLTMYLGSTLLPSRCQYWYKLGDTYYVSDSDVDRSEKVLSRTIKK
jgi:putative ABC transport system substrate-binding protein